MARLTHPLIIVGLSLASFGSAAGKEDGGPASPPAAGSADDDAAAAAEKRTAEAVAAITSALEKHDLLLSADEASGSDGFALDVRLSVPTKAAKSLVTHLRIARRADRVSIVVESADGLPYCFLTNGLLVVFDRDEPGQIAVLEGGSPVFVLEGKGG